MSCSAMIRVLLFAIAVKGDDGDCPLADAGVCGQPGSSMVQMRSGLKNKRFVTGLSEKDVDVNVEYHTPRGLELALAHAKPGTEPKVLKILPVVEVLLNDSAFNSLCGGSHDDDLFCEEDLPDTFHVYVHEMGESEETRGEEIPYGIRMVRVEELPVLPPGAVHRKKICVVDTGYDVNHNDLPSEGVTGTTPAAVPSGQSWDSDGHGHGTHCSGTIGAIGGNGRGVVGVYEHPQNFSFHIGKGLSDGGSGSNRQVLDAVEGCLDAGASVISMSLGGGGYSSAADAVYKRAYDSGVLVFAAAGNGGNSALSYPASYPNVISVAAVDSNKNRASFSQFNAQVEIAAPGVAVKSTLPDNRYASWSGTSMACPHAAGVAALVWSHFPDCSNHHIRYALLATADDQGDAGCDSRYGFGIIDAKAAYDYLKALEANGTCGGEADSGSVGGCEQGPPSPPPPPTPAPPCDRKLVVKVTTDNYPAESTWEVTDADGVKVNSGGPYTAPGTLYTTEVCLGCGTYTFTMLDSYSDGMCCSYGSGGYSIEMDGVELGSGAQFQSSEETAIGAGPPSCGPSPEPPEDPSTTPTPQCRMIPADIPENTRCRGKPQGGWGALTQGRKVSASECSEACLADDSCLFAMWKESNRKCGSWGACDNPKSKSGFKVFAKDC